jgi:hypothetical protein
MKLPSGFRPSAQQKKALEIVNRTNESAFIYGRAGTGKSSFIEYLKKNTKKNYICLSRNGMAARIIGGQTIHSFFKFPPRTILKDNDPDVSPANKQKKDLYKDLDLIIIDEISNVECDLLHAIDKVLRVKRNNESPFGGTQMLFLGDFFQISPIEPKIQSEREAFYNDYKGIWFFDSEGFNALSPKFIEFDHVHRHKDKEFRNYLEAIRRNDINENTLNYFNKRCIPGVSSKAIAVCCTNKQVSKYNDEYFSKLKGEKFTYIAESKNFKGDDSDLKEMPTNPSLMLKVGIRVMMLNNEPNWKNGDFGVATYLDKNEIKVRIYKGADLSNVEYSLDKHTWEKYKYTRIKNSDDGRYRYKPVVDGYFKQFPLKVARASTIHKSQGQTYDEILVDFGTGAFSHGQAYVALSRVRTYEGLYLKNPIAKSDVHFDERVIKFYQKHFTDTLFEESSNNDQNFMPPNLDNAAIAPTPKPEAMLTPQQLEQAAAIIDSKQKEAMSSYDSQEIEEYQEAIEAYEENTSNTDYLLDYDSKTIKYDFDDYDHNADDYEPGDTLDEGFYK